jgi:hypothetical protein
MNSKWVIWALLAASATFGLPNAAAAADGLYSSWRGLAPWAYLPPSIYVQERSPYFALHPPVYYSYPVARTYGYLPYPYLPYPVARKVVRVVPQVMINPYAAAADDSGLAPEATMPRRVHVTYPAKMFSPPE